MLFTALPRLGFLILISNDVVYIYQKKTAEVTLDYCAGGDLPPCISSNTPWNIRL